jgi:hypothetical protein
MGRVAVVAGTMDPARGLQLAVEASSAIDDKEEAEGTDWVGIERTRRRLDGGGGDEYGSDCCCSQRTVSPLP